jgi:hypothetical protein
MNSAKSGRRRACLAVPCATLLLAGAGWPRVSDAEAPQPVTYETVQGEWVGLIPSAKLLVVLRVEGKQARLAVAREDADEIVSSISDAVEFRVGAGNVRLSLANGTVLQGDLRSYAEIGNGTGVLTIPGQSQRDVYLFHLRDKSWMQQMLELRALPATVMDGVSGREGK